MFRDTNRGKIVEKLCDVSSSKQSLSIDILRKILVVADNVPTDTKAVGSSQAWLHPQTIAVEDSDRRPRAQANLFFFSRFPPQIVENRGKWADRTIRCNRPIIHGQPTCDTAFRASLRLSAGVHPPTAEAGTSGRTAPRRNRTPLEPRLRVHHVHAGRRDNRAPRR